MKQQQKPGATIGNQAFYQKFTFLKLLVILTVITWLFARCEEGPWRPHGEGGHGNHTKRYPADVAVKWINLQQVLIKTTPGFDPLVASRSFSYSGLALYESVVKGMPGYVSVASPRIGTDINKLPNNQLIYWPASANAAMASILKSLFANTSAANMNKIDSLESVLTCSLAKKQREKALHHL